MEPNKSANSAQGSNNILDLYDVKGRGAYPPEYTNAEQTYRTDILQGLQLAYAVREQPQMELNDKTYSMYYLINRQQDMAYNPPKLNPTDSRIVTGVTHEKDNTIEQIITDMNLQPKWMAYDEDDKTMIDFVQLATAVVKKSLTKENFDSKVGDLSRINISQGNVFFRNERKKKYCARKICLNPNAPAYQRKWTTVLEVEDEYCEAVPIPNTAVYLPNLLEPNIHKQPRIWVVLHIPRTAAEQVFKDFPRWKNVPMYPTSTVPPDTNGVWGDFYLQQPQKDYVEIILTESEVQNDYNILVNSVLMYPVQEEMGKITGYPLTEFSPSGQYDLIMGTNEKIPFYAYGRSIPSKNEVKEEVANEFLRIAVHKFRYSAFPSVGNLSDKVLPATIWNPAEVIPDLDAANVKVLNPLGQLTQSDFSFYQMIMNSIDDTSVSQALDAASQGNSTATEYVDQKKMALKKLGITIDGTTDFLREFYWNRLWSEIEYLDTKKKVWDAQDQMFKDAYDNIVANENTAGGSGQTHYHLKDDISDVNPYKEFQKQKKSAKGVKHVYVNPTQAKSDFKKLKDRIYVKVVSEPDGQNQSLLGILFNLLTQYTNLRGGQPIPNLNFDYLDKIIGQNSGFDIDKIFLPNNSTPATPVGMPQSGMPPQGGIPGVQSAPGTPNGASNPGIPLAPTGAGQAPMVGTAPAPKAPQNSILAGMNH